MPSYALPSLFLLIAISAAWLGGALLRLHGGSLIAFRVSILLAGAVAAVVVYWMLRRTRNAESGSPHGIDAPELASLLLSARQRLASAQIGRSRSFHTLPTLYVLGAPNAAKTTTILKSGLDPELLAGQIFEDGAVVPTRSVNLWYAQDALLIDAGEALWQDPSVWSMLVRLTSPRLLRSVFTASFPLRAAVVCVSCESFFGENAADAAATLGRHMNAALRRMAGQLGRDLPVYVVLTKLDRLPGFAEYVANLTGDEAQELLGLHIPNGATRGGVYAETASPVISSALGQLLFSLGEFRLEMLSRETVPANTPFIYQFPRELQKLRSKLSAYLLELTRPSHLQANPVLQGFYGTGVRAHFLEEMSSTPAERPKHSSRDTDATQIFSPHEIEGRKSGGVSQLVTRKVAQWCFLPRVLPEILVSGGKNKAHSIPGAQVSFLRHLALATLSVGLAIYLVGLTVSFRNNLQLERNIEFAAAFLPVTAEAPQTLASVSQLAALDRLRLALEQLEDFNRSGAPVMYRWGLYRGTGLLSPTRKLYFERFQPLLLASTQAHLVSTLDALPDSARPAANYLDAYNPLRAYLITTSHPEHSTAGFLAPVLLRFWLNGQHPFSPEQEKLAFTQFHFYADELRFAQLNAISAATPTVTHARCYLISFGDFNRMYQGMLAAASRANPAIDFNRLFPGSSATVLETHIVPGAFSRSGAAFMQNAIKHPERYFNGEGWVLGDRPQSNLSPDGLSHSLAAQYTSDFISHWQTYLRSASVVRYHSLGDARQKLLSLSAPNSALLALIATASRNTGVAKQEIAHHFQPVQAVVPSNLTDRLIAPENAEYMSGLTKLQSVLAQFVQDPSAANNPTMAQPVIAAAVSAHASVSQTAQAFNIDATGHIEQTLIKLLQQPITGAEDAIRGAAPSQVNAAGRAFCSSFASLLTKYPFDRNAQTEATPTEVSEALKPGSGSLWQFYETNLKSIIVRQGNQWTTTPGSPLQPTSAFLRFFNRAASLSNALFNNRTSTPTLTFNTHILRSPGIQTITLAVGSQRLSGSDVSRQFIWSPESAKDAQLVASYGTNELPLQFSGPWALFHLVDRGRVEQSTPALRIAYPLEISGMPIVVNGTALTERLEFSEPADSILTRGSLYGLHCVPQVAH